MNEAKIIQFNKPQLVFLSHLGQIKNATSIWGRGVGKSSIIAMLMQTINEKMPRSCWAIQGVTYQQIMAKTLPGTLGFLESIGYRRNIDYTLNRFPPDDYKLPFQCPLKADNCVFLLNRKLKTSVCFTLFSQDSKTSNRGANRDGIIVDESLLLDRDKFNEEASATNRGNREYFGNIPFHHGVFHFSSMPLGESWLFDSSKYYQKDGYDFNSLRDDICNLQLEFLREENHDVKIEIWRKHNELNRELRFYAGKNKFRELYSEYSTFDNIMHLGLEYIESMFEITPLHIFEREILNRRQTKIEGSFYPHLDRRIHCYKGYFDNTLLAEAKDTSIYTSVDNSKYDLDCLRREPLHVGLDFGTIVNWLVVGQNLVSINQFNFLKCFYVKQPQFIDDVVRKFCDYYSEHGNKMVYLYPDGEGNQKRANQPGQLSYVDQIVKILRRNKWSVKVVKTEKYNEENHLTYLTWARCLSGQMPDLFPAIRFNEINCMELVYSMEQTPAIDIGGRIKKDKSSESRLKDNREQATDAGDAADQIIQRLFGKLNGRVNDSRDLLKKIMGIQ